MDNNTHSTGGTTQDDCRLYHIDLRWETRPDTDEPNLSGRPSYTKERRTFIRQATSQRLIERWAYRHVMDVVGLPTTETSTVIAEVYNYWPVEVRNSTGGRPDEIPGGRADLLRQITPRSTDLA